MTTRLSPIEARARLRAGEKLRDMFFDNSGRPKAKLAGLEGEVRVRGLLDPSDRSAEFVISTGSLDRYNSTIAPAGWRLDAFKANSVVLWSHDDSIPAIARAENTFIDGDKLRSQAIFATRDMHPLADTVYQLVKAKFISAASVGWVPLDYEIDGDGVIHYLEQELLEWSVVNIPANPECLTRARSFGIDTRPLAEWAEQSLDLGVTHTPRRQLEKLRKTAGASRIYPVRIGTNIMQRKSAARVDSAFRKWDTFGEFLVMVARAFGDRGIADRRLVRAPTGAGEIDPSGGGFLVADQFLPELVGIMYEEAILAPLCDRRETSAPLGGSIKIPAIDETSRQEGSHMGGVQIFWQGEGTQDNPTTPKIRNNVFAPKKMIGGIVVTSELLDDAPALEGHVKRIFGAEFSFKIDLAIFSGTGAGQPLGIMNSPCLISVSKETGQASQTLVAENVRKMWSRLPAPCRRRAVWLINEDLEEQLEAMVDITGTSGAATPAASALYMPAGVGGNEYPLLKGRPVLAIEQAALLGTPGDIVLADLQSYIWIDEASALHSVWTFGSPTGRPCLDLPAASMVRAPITAPSRLTTDLELRAAHS